jgi:hypothetical protein
MIYDKYGYGSEISIRAPIIYLFEIRQRILLIFRLEERPKRK